MLWSCPFFLFNQNSLLCYQSFLMLLEVTLIRFCIIASLMLLGLLAACFLRIIQELMLLGIFISTRYLTS